MLTHDTGRGRQPYTAMPLGQPVTAQDGTKYFVSKQKGVKVVQKFNQDWYDKMPKNRKDNMPNHYGTVIFEDGRTGFVVPGNELKYEKDFNANQKSQSQNYRDKLYTTQMNGMTPAEYFKANPRPTRSSSNGPAGRGNGGDGGRQGRSGSRGPVGGARSRSAGPVVQEAAADKHYELKFPATVVERASAQQKAQLENTAGFFVSLIKKQPFKKFVVKEDTIQNFTEKEINNFRSALGQVMMQIRLDNFREFTDNGKRMYVKLPGTKFKDLADQGEFKAWQKATIQTLKENPEARIDIYPNLKTHLNENELVQVDNWIKTMSNFLKTKNKGASQSGGTDTQHGKRAPLVGPVVKHAPHSVPMVPPPPAASGKGGSHPTPRPAAAGKAGAQQVGSAAGTSQVAEKYSRAVLSSDSCLKAFDQFLRAIDHELSISKSFIPDMEFFKKHHFSKLVDLIKEFLVELDEQKGRFHGTDISKLNLTKLLAACRDLNKGSNLEDVVKKYKVEEQYQPHLSLMKEMLQNSLVDHFVELSGFDRRVNFSQLYSALRTLDHTLYEVLKSHKLYIDQKNHDAQVVENIKKILPESEGESIATVRDTIAQIQKMVDDNKPIPKVPQSLVIPSIEALLGRLDYKEDIQDKDFKDILYHILSTTEMHLLKNVLWSMLQYTETFKKAVQSYRLAEVRKSNPQSETGGAWKNLWSNSIEFETTAEHKVRAKIPKAENKKTVYRGTVHNTVPREGNGTGSRAARRRDRSEIDEETAKRMVEDRSRRVLPASAAIVPSVNPFAGLENMPESVVPEVNSAPLPQRDRFEAASRSDTVRERPRSENPSAGTVSTMPTSRDLTEVPPRELPAAIKNDLELMEEKWKLQFEREKDSLAPNTTLEDYIKAKKAALQARFGRGTSDYLKAEAELLRNRDQTRLSSKLQY